MRFRLVLSGMLSGLLLAGLMSSPASAQVITGQDDFGTGFVGAGVPSGGNQVFSTRVLTPNNQANPGFGGAPGTFGGSFFDYYGISDRRINFDVADDSNGSFPPDSFGFAGDTGSSEDCGNFIVMSDVQNDNNPSGVVTAVWTFDVSDGKGGSNYNIHRISLDMVAYGDFEGPPPPMSMELADEVIFSGGVTSNSTLFEFRLTEKQDDANILYQVFMDNGVTYDTYFTPFFDFENWLCLTDPKGGPGLCAATGDTVAFHPDDDGGAADDGTASNGIILQPTFSNPLNTTLAYEETNTNGTFNEIEQAAFRDPLIEQGSGIQLDNTKKTFTKVVKETGSTFTLNMIATQNSSPEVIAFDNILLESAVLGDANNDGEFTNVDIASFVLALTNAKMYAMMFPGVDPDFVLDMNCDGVLNNTDISFFVEALTGG